ncbi:MAG TPA: SulP family inorganic anion transporter [Anaeromyxobacteraceae bacterium]
MRRERILPEVGAGLAAALMALPTALGNGLLAFAPLGPAHAAAGAAAGLVGAVVLGAAAALLGGTPGLVSVPSGPAAAMLTALAAQFAAADPPRAPVLLLATALLAGAAQLGFGALRLGAMVKFIPYPVVAGFLSAAGLLLAWGQIPFVAGLADGGPLQALGRPGSWRAAAVLTAAVTFAAAALAHRLLPRVPPVLAGLCAGTLAFLGFSAFDPGLAAAGSPLRVGPVPGARAVLAAFPGRLAGLVALSPAELLALAGPAAALAALLSVDTLKSCVLVDSVTGHRHAGNRELLAQGIGNALSALAGGAPGSGVSGATLVNLGAGGRARLSSTAVPASLLAVAAAAPGLVAGTPRAVLGGVLVHVGLRTVDWGALRLARRPEARLDLAVVAAVVAAALASGLVVAAAAGVGLAVVLFVRDHARRSPVRSRGTVAGIRSSHRRLPPEDAVLTARGAEAAVLTLQGDLFFGTADRLLTELEPELRTCRLVLLGLSRVADVDLTAARILAQAESRLAARGGTLLLAEARAPEALAGAMEDVAPRPRRSPARFFASRDEALEWCEERILEAHLEARPAHGPRPLAEMDLLAGLSPELLAALERQVEVVAAADGERVFRAGEPGDALYLVRVGRLRLVVPAEAGRELMLGVFGRGDVVGELAFVDGRRRSADAVACAPTELYRLTRPAFEAAAREAPALRAELAARLARVLTYRLRVTTSQLKAAEE